MDHKRKPQTKWSLAPALARLVRLGHGGAVAVVLLLAMPAASLAAVSPDDPFAGLEVMGRADLAATRGGFDTGVLGLDVNLGANVRSTIDGEIVLESLVRFTPRGIETTHVTPNLGNLPVELQDLEFLGDNTLVGLNNARNASGGANNGGTVASSVQTVSLPSAAPGTAGNSSGLRITMNGASVPEGFEGVVLNGTNGVTALLQKFTNGQFVNLVAVTEPGRRAAQEVELQVTVRGFGNLQGIISTNNTLAGIARSLNAAILNSLAP